MHAARYCLNCRVTNNPGTRQHHVPDIMSMMPLGCWRMWVAPSALLATLQPGASQLQTGCGCDDDKRGGRQAWAARLCVLCEFWMQPLGSAICAASRAGALLTLCKGLLSV
jgi:hypothetical protein